MNALSSHWRETRATNSPPRHGCEPVHIDQPCGAVSHGKAASIAGNLLGCHEPKGLTGRVRGRGVGAVGKSPAEATAESLA